MYHVPHMKNGRFFESGIKDQFEEGKRFIILNKEIVCVHKINTQFSRVIEINVQPRTLNFKLLTPNIYV